MADIKQPRSSENPPPPPAAGSVDVELLASGLDKLADTLEREAKALQSRNARDVYVHQWARNVRALGLERDGLIRDSQAAGAAHVRAREEMRARAEQAEADETLATDANRHLLARAVRAETGKGEAEAELAALREAWDELLEKAAQLAEVARDWNLDEVEINGEMIATLALSNEFRAALAGGGSDG